MEARCRRPRCVCRRLANLTDCPLRISCGRRGTIRKVTLVADTHDATRLGFISIEGLTGEEPTVAIVRIGTAAPGPCVDKKNAESPVESRRPQQSPAETRHPQEEKTSQGPEDLFDEPSGCEPDADPVDSGTSEDDVAGNYDVHSESSGGDSDLHIESLKESNQQFAWAQHVKIRRDEETRVRDRRVPARPAWRRRHRHL